MWHSVFALLGMVCGSALGIALCVRRIALSKGSEVALWAVAAGLLFSRLFHVVDAWSYYSQHLPEVFLVSNGGASVTGAVVGGLTGALVALRRMRLPIGWTFDRGVLGLPLGMAIGRIGDVINGEHWATACSGLPWCVRYTDPASLGQRDFVHPAVAYELVGDLVILGVMAALLRRGGVFGREGLVPFVFLGLYGLLRLSLAPVRLDPIWLAGVSQAVVVSLAFIVVSLGALVPRLSAAMRTQHA